ncbi:SCO family protein [Pseudodesulfovibrio sp. zrk46]|uniref:SCO family protein n=1 Tax=Pseudodesulfovibrio sp. zrk46 TaxID=2725288 RepID=UPI001449DF23|nr:SCO family protein [Pseudodesulfovibrio sp. zrk46]QJB56722.1 SCO family protein [Pseudodesulfovibrio sp. zrk46]
MQRLIAIAILIVLMAAPSWAATEHGSMQHGDDHSSMAQEAMPHDGKDHSKLDLTEEGHMDHGDMANESMEGHEAHQDQSMTDHDMEGMDAEAHDHEKMMEEVKEADIPVGIEEKLGNVLPDVEFTDSEGNKVRLLELVKDTPVMLLPIYYRCPDVCNLLQGGFASILPKVALKPGEEIKVVSLSFAPEEQTKDAARAKRNYTAILDGKFPPEYWTFLTGDQQSIDQTLDAIGYTVQKQGKLWAHPVAAIAIAPGGKVVRYLYGTTFLPFDITMAGTEAAQGKTGLSIKRLLSYCYNYDPDGRRYVFDILRVSGFSILGFVGIFLAWLILGGKKKRR